MDQQLLREAALLRDEAKNMLESCFGRTVFFEHGPALPRQSVGCGVDHAHLHLVATKVNLLEGAKKLSSQLCWKAVSGLESTSRLYNEGASYLYLEQSEGDAWATSHPNIESQLFRKVIAATVNELDRYNWRDHSFEHHVRDTVARFKNWKEHLSFPPTAIVTVR